MAFRKCCVTSCNSTSKTHRLFNLPKNDKLRELWLSFLIPTSIELSGLSKEQLINKRVCQNHFERNQFDRFGNRLPHGYPSLFTPKEILYGISLSSSAGDHLSDHNYFLQSEPEDSNEAVTTAVAEGDHTYGKSHSCEVPIPSEVIFDNTIQATQVEFSDTTKIVEQDRIVKHYKNLTRKPIEQKVAAKKKKDSSNHFTSTFKCTCFIKTMKQKAIAVSKDKKSFGERLAEAQKLSKDPLLMKNFFEMSKQAQDFVMLQLKSVNKKKKAMRFTNDEKLLALTLMKESPKGYRLLQKIFKLPTKRTLNRLAEKIIFNVGINDNIFRLLEQKALKWETKKKICSIIFDEVALTPHLTYVESKDIIKGFKDLGDEKYLTYADHALVFMIRGVCCNWKQPIAYYFCEGTTSAGEVKRILKEVVAKVSGSGLLPIALVCDQGTTFRSAIKMFRLETKQKRNLSGENNDGTIEISGQCLSVVYDPPHLLKGLRNNFLTKNIIYEGKMATWQDILSVYKSDCLLGHTRLNKKLTQHHVVADKIKKMKVSVAAQTLSQQTSAMLKYTALYKTTVTGEPVSETMRTTGDVEFIDKLFDSVNGAKTNSVKGKLRGPIKPNSEHFSFWQEARKTLKEMKFIDSTSKKAKVNKREYFVRVPSLDGWITSLESLERIAKLLFKKYNLSYFYPRNINQDPLENFFGRIRAINYRNVNPDCYTFVNSFKSLLISNVMGPHSIYSNCEEDDGQTILDFFNLLKDDSEMDDDKENVPVDMNSLSRNQLAPKLAQSSTCSPILTAINERVRVHSSAYTAGFFCRRMSNKFNCKNCKETYTAEKKDNFHLWIAQREYKSLKHRNLAYPSKRFLILYRDISDHIHNILNKSAHKNNIGKYLLQDILSKFHFNWLGCANHKTVIIDYFLRLILRVHIHNWCNMINKILRGDVEEDAVKKMSLPQLKAYNKYKTHRLRNKKK